jgi:hypothetical protein
MMAGVWEVVKLRSAGLESDSPRPKLLCRVSGEFLDESIG